MYMHRRVIFSSIEATRHKRYTSHAIPAPCFNDVLHVQIYNGYEIIIFFEYIVVI